MGVFESCFNFVPLNLVGDRVWEKPSVSMSCIFLVFKNGWERHSFPVWFCMAQPSSSCNKQEGFVPAGEVACEETATCPPVRAADNGDGLVTRHATCLQQHVWAWEEVTPCGWERTSPLPTLPAQTRVGMPGHASWDGLHSKGSCCHPSEPPLGLLQLRNSPQSCREPLKEGSAASPVCAHLPRQSGLYSHFNFNSSAPCHWCQLAHLIKLQRRRPLDWWQAGLMWLFLSTQVQHVGGCWADIPTGSSSTDWLKLLWIDG